MRWTPLLAVLLALSGCHGPARPPAAVDHSTVKLEPVEVSSAEFGAATQKLLASGAFTADRLSLLVGVVRHQLSRAGALFARGQEEAGLAALTGALYLVRDGELREEMFVGSQATLGAGAASVARAGSEGKALAFYSLLQRALPEGPERAEVEQHLNALRLWQQNTNEPGTMQAAGTEQQAAVERSLFEPSAATRKDAQEKAMAWISKARVVGEQGPPQSVFEGEERAEANRAYSTGALTLAALHLRHGDAVSAMLAMESDDVSRIVPSILADRIVGAAEDGAPEAWGELFDLFASASQHPQQDGGVEEALVHAAAWGTAVELYRSAPKDFRAGIPLSRLLLENGLAEVAPVLFAPQVEQATPKEVSWVMTYALEAIVRAESAGDIAGARMVFRNAGPYVARATEPENRSRIRPSAAQLQYVMGAIETREGELDAARAHLNAALAFGPSAEPLKVLAAIDRQRGKYPAALSSLDAVIKLQRTEEDLAGEAETELAKAEIFVVLKDNASVERSLNTALRKALEARGRARSSGERATAERTLARILECFGERDGARRATDRAYLAAQSDGRQVSATLLDSARRALTLGDIAAARQAAQRGLESGLPPEDLVYLGLWLQLLEQKLSLPGDGTVEEALGEIDNVSSWPGKLKSWALKELTDEALVQQARSRVEKVEAQFYVAMRAFVKSRSEGTASKLEQIAMSEAIQLVEVEIARDMLAQAQYRPPLPSDAQVP